MSSPRFVELPYYGKPKERKFRKPYISATQEPPYEHDLAADSKSLTSAYETYPSEQDVFEEVARRERQLGAPLFSFSITITKE